MVEDIELRIKKALISYNDRYKTHFTLGKGYYLFPDNAEFGYKHQWPGNLHAGVYFALSAKDLLYIGESKELGQRRYQHFPSKNIDGNQICSFSKETWQKEPAYLYVSVAPDDAKWKGCLWKNI